MFEEERKKKQRQKQTNRYWKIILDQVAEDLPCFQSRLTCAIGKELVNPSNPEIKDSSPLTQISLVFLQILGLAGIHLRSVHSLAGYQVNLEWMFGVELNLISVTGRLQLWIFPPCNQLMSPAGNIFFSACFDGRGCGVFVKNLEKVLLGGWEVDLLP